MTTGVPMPDREYTNNCQLIVVAGDETTAQAGLSQAEGAIAAALEGLNPPVRLLTEKEDGRWVMSQA